MLLLVRACFTTDSAYMVPLLLSLKCQLGSNAWRTWLNLEFYKQHAMLNGRSPYQT